MTQSQTNTHDAYSPIVPGEKFIDHLSMLTSRVGGARLENVDVSASGGSYQALLDAGMMANEIQVMDKMKTYLDNLMGEKGGGLEGGRD